MYGHENQKETLFTGTQGRASARTEGSICSLSIIDNLSYVVPSGVLFLSPPWKDMKWQFKGTRTGGTGVEIAARETWKVSSKGVSSKALGGAGSAES